MNAAAVTIIILIGAVAVIEAVSILLKIPEYGCSGGFTAVIVLNSEDNVEFKIESILHKLRWTEDEFVKKIIIINNGLNNEQLSICHKLCGENSVLQLANPDEALDLIISCEKMM